MSDAMGGNMEGQDAIVFCIVNKTSGVCGFTWFVEAHGTSFYIKSTYPPLQSMKVSLHGPDPNHAGKEHFRLGFTDAKQKEKAVRRGGAWGFAGQELPLYFNGRKVNRRTVHIVRFSAEGSMFLRGMQRGPNPSPKKKATLHATLTAPPVGKAFHVDVYLSKGRPYFENREERLRKEDAVMGPLVNNADQYLTAVASHVFVANSPDPFGDDLSNGADPKECVRGLIQGVDETGLLWICEKMISKSKF